MNKVALGLTLSSLMMLASGGLAAAQSVTFSTEHGNVLREHANSHRHNSFRDEHFRAQVGTPVPAQVELHDLPPALRAEL
jgi:hypothetical protein